MLCISVLTATMLFLNRIHSNVQTRRGAFGSRIFFHTVAYIINDKMKRSELYSVQLVSDAMVLRHILFSGLVP